ncbi:hypothetical protein [Subtercola boreus]|uniref:Uncharacterized protein n=1 Tax=Subtercola boreus TaxID=120213 RepID=A0A3E0WB88_9MICO|nr:hypothetical protein [Subtercola boreus]RFA21111.1 hypothetical protein B7R24_06865 [Subtercola boreus]RFA21494.1 hypothetical protein B7R23_06810 [Subtercola boreus]RFA27465.1 hypothetical protein B7R25_06935 [Subtercola boreus]
MSAAEPSDDRAPLPRTTAAEREARAEEALQAILAGGDLGQEAQRLSNGFTDEYAGRIGAWLRRHLGRPPA